MIKRLALLNLAVLFCQFGTGNHPSGDPTPSEADIKVTRDLTRAGQLLKIELLDHVIMGTTVGNRPGHQSLRALGYFHS